MITNYKLKAYFIENKTKFTSLGLLQITILTETERVIYYVMHLQGFDVKLKTSGGRFQILSSCPRNIAKR